ncbi:hypothetical protein SAMN04488134_11093 [Amphibacillus marinus]|uniref:Cytoplasmic protein n=1 Tax=Amphibacillus marinus TaxID=872970 RepID=A0A1H8RH60_9BACI|nr:ClbS/DfsB family four-helix bundle protein [Amphibacillus marinus]SEO65869.1 hypothetical protein SAMN04488134_11093 [Amphibacillus marinus]
MQAYENRQALIDEIVKRADLFIDEFNTIDNKNKDILISDVDRSPSQMIAYQLGWINLLLDWEHGNQNEEVVVTPSPNYKWNNLGGLYEHFYQQYANYSLQELIELFHQDVNRIVKLVECYSDDDLFVPGKRQWASTTPSNWPIWKWIHINTVAPFKTFRTKIRKWRKLNTLEN